MSQRDLHFSKRTGWDLGESDRSRAIAKVRASRNDILDLTLSNPTVCGFEFDVDAVLEPFSDRALMHRALTYHPDPRGLRSAREAVAAYYARHQAASDPEDVDPDAVDPDAIILTTSTSEAYSFLFRLLCDAGDEVLVAQPSYPLFDFLADLDDVTLRPYPLFYDFGWWIDFAELEGRIGPKTRAILVVHPNNPTGHWTHRAERKLLEALCVRHGLTLIVDEVFLDYPLDASAAESFATKEHPALTFVLSGISKVAALPQMKVAWIASFGPSHLLAEAQARLEVIADTFLSMNAPAQLALPAWLAGSERVQRQILARAGANLDALEVSGLGLLKAEAGWSAVVQLRSLAATAETLLDKLGVIVHPGSLYGMTDPKMVVISLLTPSAVMKEALDRIVNCRSFDSATLRSG